MKFTFYLNGHSHNYCFCKVLWICVCVNTGIVITLKELIVIPINSIN